MEKQVTLDFQSAVYLECRNTDCEHNEVLKGKMSCNLKNVIIGKGGVCSQILKLQDWDFLNLKGEVRYE